MLLEVKGLSRYFGGLEALKDVDFNIGEGEILGLIGPNGAGKTTLFNVIGGVYRPDRGTVRFKGENIAGLEPYQICRRGMSRTFQIPKPFRNLSVLDNVTAGVVFGKQSLKKVGRGKEKAREILQFMGLSGKEGHLPGGLTIADLKRLELARALATSPDLLLLDEVVAGLNPSETADAIQLIKKIKNELGLTIFMIEHVMKAVMSISDRIMVLQYGEKIAEGTPQEVAENGKVVDAYLGEKYVF
jgi:branched-chain amino acid transport system ATP-binding protein